MPPSIDQRLHAFGRRVAALRKEARLTQEELASKAGIGAKYLSEVERGATNPSLTIMYKLAGGLGVRLPRLVAEPGNLDLEIAALLTGKSKAEQARALAVLKVMLSPAGDSGF